MAGASTTLHSKVIGTLIKEKVQVNSRVLTLNMTHKVIHMKCAKEK